MYINSSCAAGPPLHRTAKRGVFPPWATLALVLGALLAPTPSVGACLSPAGDFNLDGYTDVLDVQCHILGVLWQLAGADGPLPICLNAQIEDSDLNCDGLNNVTDLLLTIRAALTLSWDVAIDADADMCADNCTLILRGAVLGDGAMMGTDNGTLTVDQRVGSKRFIHTTTNGTFTVQPGLQGGTAP